MTEERLARQCCAGHPAAWRELIRRYRPLVRGIARNILDKRGIHTNSDSLEEGLVNFFGEICLRRKKTLGRFRGEGRLKSYLAILAANYFRSEAASATRDRESGRRESTDRIRSVVSVSPESALESTEASAAIVALVDGLPPQDRLLYQVLFVDQLRPAEAARLMGLTRDSLYVRKHRFLKRIETMLARGQAGRERSSVKSRR